MTATAHALVGGAIAASVPNPALGITLATISHPIMDMLPHWDFGWGWKKKTKLTLFVEASLDLLFGVLLSFAIFGKNIDPLYFMLIIFFSEIWDLLEVPYWFLNWKFPPFSSIYNVQHTLQGKIKLPWGILTQVATVGGVVLFLRLVR